MEEKLTLKNKTNVLTINIYRENGEYTGNNLVFNLKNLDTIGKYDEMHQKLTKNTKWYNDQKIIIRKQQDFKSKDSLMTNNEKKLYELNKEYLKKQIKAFDLFLGDGGVNKVLDGDSFDLDSILIIRDYIEKQILPYLKISKENIVKEMNEKYGLKIEDVLEDNGISS